MAETNAMELQRDASGCVKSEPKMESMQSVDDTIGEHDKDIPRLADRVPPQIWFAMIISTCERFAYYGLQSPFRGLNHLLSSTCFYHTDCTEENYLQNSSGDSLRPGALGLGQSTATAISYLFSFLVCVLPFPMGIMIDSYLGRYHGLVYFTG
jgi:dipeptide/tripeptide permease